MKTPTTRKAIGAGVAAALLGGLLFTATTAAFTDTTSQSADVDTATVLLSSTATVNQSTEGLVPGENRVRCFEVTYDGTALANQHAPVDVHLDNGVFTPANAGDNNQTDVDGATNDFDEATDASLMEIDVDFGTLANPADCSTFTVDGLLGSASFTGDEVALGATATAQATSWDPAPTDTVAARVTYTLNAAAGNEWQDVAFSNDVIFTVESDDDTDGISDR